MWGSLNKMFRTGDNFFIYFTDYHKNHYYLSVNHYCAKIPFLTNILDDVFITQWGFWNKPRHKIILFKNRSKFLYSAFKSYTIGHYCSTKSSARHMSDFVYKRVTKKKHYMIDGINSS